MRRFADDPGTLRDTECTLHSQHIVNHYEAPPPPPPPHTESYGKSPSSSFPTYSAVPHHGHGPPPHAPPSAPIEEPLFDGFAQPPPPGKYQERNQRCEICSLCAAGESGVIGIDWCGNIITDSNQSTAKSIPSNERLCGKCLEECSRE